MRKNSVFEFFNGRDGTASAFGVTRQAVSQWPDTLTRELIAKFVLAVIHAGRMDEAQKQFPKLFKAR